MDIAVEEVWNNIIEAFRYAKVSEDIFNYLNEMIRPVYTGLENESTGFDYKNFEKCYIEGMKKHILSHLAIHSPIKEYLAEPIPVNNQIGCAFRNLTWFLTGHKYNNDFGEFLPDSIREMISSDFSDINCKNWHLGYYDFSNINLSNAHFDGADLDHTTFENSIIQQQASFKHANLSEAIMNGANLEGSVLDNACMVGTIINNANLVGASLKGAYISEANLSESNLSNADLRDAVICDTNLSYASLRNADLTGADLAGSIHGSADFSGAKVSRAKNY
jgi:uncharacterized protein YjbI with pentapeptide repeats